MEVNRKGYNSRSKAMVLLWKSKDKITFSEISNTMSDEKVMLLMGHKAWRSCYDQRNPEQVIKKLKTM